MTRLILAAGIVAVCALAFTLPGNKRSGVKLEQVRTDASHTYGGETVACAWFNEAVR